MVEKAQTEALNLNPLDSKSQPQSTAVAQSLNVMLDVPVELVFELARTKISIQKLLALTPGAIVELNNVPVDSLDIFIDGTAIAKGDLISMKENYAVRLGEAYNLIAQGDK